MKKTDIFFDELQTNSLVTSFTDTQFRSLVPIPNVRISKSNKHNCWIAKILLANELFYSPYPFLLPDLFQNYTSVICSIQPTENEYKKKFYSISQSPTRA
jgi:hypothetical protein